MSEDEGEGGRSLRESLEPHSLVDAPCPSGTITEGPRSRGLGLALAAALVSPAVWLASAIVLIEYEDNVAGVPGGPEPYSFASLGPFYSAVFVLGWWGAPAVFVAAVVALAWGWAVWAWGELRG